MIYITPEMRKLGRVSKVKVFFLVLVYVFTIDLLEFSAAISEKSLLFFLVHMFWRVTEGGSLL